MKVVLLCGGQGTRLREATESRPKPMVEIGGRPVLWHIMKLYAWHGFNDFVLCLGYRGDVIREYFLNYRAMNTDCTVQLGQPKVEFHGGHEEENFSVTLAETGEASMTGGRLKRVAKYLDDDHFMLTYGDGIADVDIRRLTEFHKSHGRLATMTTVRATSRFGVVNIANGGRVDAFAEKPKSDGWINAGYFVFHRRVLDYVGGDETILEREPLERLAAEGELMAFRHEGFFQAMDTFREYQQLNEMWSSGEAPWKAFVTGKPEGDAGRQLLSLRAYLEQAQQPRSAVTEVVSAEML